MLPFSFRDPKVLELKSFQVMTMEYEPRPSPQKPPTVGTTQKMVKLDIYMEAQCPDTSRWEIWIESA